jgi:hypothetical protein
MEGGIVWKPQSLQQAYLENKYAGLYPLGRRAATEKAMVVRACTAEG